MSSASKLMHEKFMKIALSLAEEGFNKGEIPVGALIVQNGKIISSATNLRENGGAAIAHAEIIAIERACKKLGNWRLSNCSMYVTLEPCPMCAGAIINARIDNLIFGAKDPRAGAMGSILNLNSYPLGHKVNILSGILENECSDLLRRFFTFVRKEKNIDSQK